MMSSTINAKNEQEEKDGQIKKKSRKTVKRRLETGQTVAMTPQDDRMIRLAYDYMSGFVKRTTLQQLIEKKKADLSIVMIAMPTVDFEELNVKNNKKDTLNYIEDGIEEYAAASIAVIEEGVSEPLDITEEDINLQLYLKVKDELTLLEDRLEVHLSRDNKITIKDLDAVLKQQYGVTVTKKQLEQMIWEVDENMDELISWDELQLSFCRNVSDISSPSSVISHNGCEPCAFFRITEFLTFDEHRKGYVIEDDCMEILFSRYGSKLLEKELHLLFGENLRALGGDGTLYLERYLRVLTQRSGRRAQIIT